MDDFPKKVDNLEMEIRRLKKARDQYLKTVKQKLEKLGYIDNFAGLKLYYDRVETKERTLKIDSGLQAAAQIDGSVYATTKVSGGGARPTLTRIAAGAMIAGPLGALIGGATQKHKSIESSTSVHDDRIYRVVITGPDGYVEGKTTSRAKDPQTFVGKVLNAIADYPKDRKLYDAEKKQLEAEIENCSEQKLLTKKEKELEALLNKATDAQREALAKYRSKQKARAVIIVLLLIAAFYGLALWLKAAGVTK